ncbi:hypothetical protein [Cupriavidus pampae]|uniref:Uncharacterized protein n=1 Tax=Cupriavidus pampae TaxID=659251 RepID=A0ABN7YS09_9BURK|nr:hypothetical protein [Cupriavidus pampae]CAG9175015.1 hypothetical protein LMG32289_03203 [Cupriavidus pampae]
MSSLPQYAPRLAQSHDANRLDVWLAALRPLPVPDARARRLALEALLAQGGQGACVMIDSSDGTMTVQALLPVTLVHSLLHAGRVAMVTEWWCAAANPASASSQFDACVALLDDWCRAHGIRHVLAAPALLSGSDPATGFMRDTSGLWRRDCVPAAKSLG